MKRQRKKRFFAGLLCFLLCFTLNIDPVATICGAIVESGVVDRFVNLKDNLIYLATNSASSITEVLADDTSISVSCSCSFSCDASSAIDKVMGSGSITISDLNNRAGEIKDAISTMDTNVDNSFAQLSDDLQVQFTVLNGKMDDVITQLGDINEELDSISERLASIQKTIQSQQHNYRVAHLYSLNNTYSNCLWKPYSSDIPYVSDFATVTGQFANVYSGYWDTGISTLNNPGNLVTKRAQEILGYDIIVRSEGLVLQKDVKTVNDQTAATGLSGNNQSYVAVDNSTQATNSILSYYQEMMPEENICWIDAVTTLYRALGQEQISYQSFMSYDSSITPETSPVYQGLSNPVPDEDGNYAGYDFYMFLTRSNVISKELSKSGETIDSAKVEYIYWEKALNGGFIPSEYINSAREPITFAQFFQLAARMMQAYGEPVLNDDELKALLQVYGTHYPIQLGTDIADAWAYMAARGILDFSEYTEGSESILYDITYTGYISRDQLLTMCMRIADEDSRTDYKNINIVLNLSDVMKEDYYYPVYDMKISNGEFATSSGYDHVSASCYDYLVRKTNEMTLGDIGTAMVFSEKTTDTSKLIDGASVAINTITLTDGSEWYDISVPKTYTGNIYVTMHTEGNAKMSGNTVNYIVIPNTALGGGYYSKYSISGGDATVSTDSGSYLLFDKKVEYATRNCTDYSRAGADKPTAGAGETASNATILDILAAKVDKYTSPVVAYAADVSTTTNDISSMNQYYWRATIYSAKVTDTTSTQNTITSLNDYKLGSLSDITGFSDPLFNDSNDDMTLSTKIPTSQDVLALNRLCALYEYGTKLYGSGGFASFQASSSVGGSILAGMEDYLFNSNSTNDSESNFWKELYASKSNDFTQKETSQLSSGDDYTYSVKKKYDTFITQFLLGTLPGTNTRAIQDDSHLSSSTPSSTWNNDKYNSISSSDYNSFLKDYISQLYTDGQDELISGWIDKGVVGASYTNGSYTVYGMEAGLDALREDLGDEDKLNSAAAASSNIEGTAIETSVATSTIMDRNQQILISWDDMCASGYIVNTGSYAQPTMQSNGAYYFMTKEGQVIVNDTQHTIQIGNTLYDLMYSTGYYPTLVYIDTEQNNTMYFDYRCIMGVVSSQFTINEGLTETFQSSFGVGDCVVYDLQSNGVSSDWYNTLSVKCYNYPDVTGSGLTSSSAVTNLGYSVNLIKSTLYDGQTFTDYTYWDKTDIDMSRLRMSTFVPTSNYLCLIKDEEDGPDAQLYVYYLRTAFEDGFVDKGSDTLKQVPEPANASERWADIATKVENASLSYSTGGVSFAQQLENIYGYSPSDDTMPWYIKMTYDALADLYERTGKYYFSQDYVVRRFDISDMSITNTCGWDTIDGDLTKNVEITSNDAGAIYWVDSIGFIYNMPSDDEFTLEKYLSGEYLLPLTLDESDSSNPKIINYNLNYYGTTMNFDNNAKVSGDWLPYGVVLTGNTSSPYVKIDSSVYNGITLNNLAVRDDIYTNEGESERVLPFMISSDVGVITAYGGANAVNCFIPAPCGIYNKFGGNSLETLEVNDITQYVSDATKLYYGSTQVRLYTSDSQSTSKQFEFVSTKYNPIAIDGSTKAYRVYRSTSFDVLIIEPDNIAANYGSGVGEIEIDDYYTNPLEDWLTGLGTSDLITAIDEGASFLIIFAFEVMPIIGIILMTILIGLSFVGEIKIVQILCTKFIDPVRILTLGNRDITNWNWRKVLVPCILLYVAFALFLNGNIIRIIMWGAEWYGTIMKWAKSL